MQMANRGIQFVIIEKVEFYRILVCLQTGLVAVGKDGSLYLRRRSSQEALTQTCPSTQRPAKWEGRETGGTFRSVSAHGADRKVQKQLSHAHSLSSMTSAQRIQTNFFMLWTT